MPPPEQAPAIGMGKEILESDVRMPYARAEAERVLQALGEEKPQQQPAETGSGYAQKSVFETVRFVCESQNHLGFCSPLPPGYSAGLRERYLQVIAEVRGIRQYMKTQAGVMTALPDEPLPSEKIQKELAAKVKAYQTAIDTYERAVVAESGSAMEAMAAKYALSPEERDAMRDVVRGHHPILPLEPLQTMDTEKPEHSQWHSYQQVSLKFIELHTLTHQAAAELTKDTPDLKIAADFKKALQEYAVLRKRYDEDCRRFLAPTFIAAFNKANRGGEAAPGNEPTFAQWNEIVQHIQNAVPPPPRHERFTPAVRAYLEGRHLWLQDRQRGILKEVRDITLLLGLGQEIPTQKYKALLDSSMTYVHALDEYRVAAKLAKPEETFIQRFKHLGVFAGGLAAATKAVPALGGAAAESPIPRERLKQLQLEYDKMRASLEAKGMKTLPTFAEFTRVNRHGPLGQVMHDMMRSAHVSPMDFLLFAAIVNVSEDKVKASAEFAGAILAMNGANAAHTAVFERLMLGASKWKGTRPVYWMYMNAPGPPAAKVLLGVGALAGFHKDIEKGAKAVSAAVPHGVERRFAEDLLHDVSLGPVTDALGSLDDRVRGIDPRSKALGDNPALTFLMHKRGISPRMRPDIHTWNERIALHAKWNPKEALFVEAEKIDAGWVPRQAARLDNQRSLLLMAEQEMQREFEALAKKGELKGFSGTMPSLVDFVTDPTIPLEDDRFVTVGDLLLRANDGSIGALKDNPAFSVRCAGIHRFRTMLDTCTGPKAAEMQKLWRTHVKSAAQMGEVVSCFRYLGVYDKQAWFDDPEKKVVRQGLLEEVIYRSKRTAARNLAVERGEPFTLPWFHEEPPLMDTAGKPLAADADRSDRWDDRPQAIPPSAKTDDAEVGREKGEQDPKAMDLDRIMEDRLSLRLRQLSRVAHKDWHPETIVLQANGKKTTLQLYFRHVAIGGKEALLVRGLPERSGGNRLEAVVDGVEPAPRQDTVDVWWPGRGGKFLSVPTIGGRLPVPFDTLPTGGNEMRPLQESGLSTIDVLLSPPTPAVEQLLSLCSQTRGTPKDGMHAAHFALFRELGKKSYGADWEPVGTEVHYRDLLQLTLERDWKGYIDAQSPDFLRALAEALQAQRWTVNARNFERIRTDLQERLQQKLKEQAERKRSR